MGEGADTPEADDAEEELQRALGPDVTLIPGDAADPQALVDSKVPADIRKKYDVVSYRNAAVILSESRRAEFDEILAALRGFQITTKMIRTAGGNESDIPKIFSQAL